MKLCLVCGKKNGIKEEDNFCPKCGAKLPESTKPATYVSERVVNIKELENYIENAHLSVCSLIRGIETEQLSDVCEVAKRLKKIDEVLVKAYTFEICVDLGSRRSIKKKKGNDLLKTG